MQEPNDDQGTLLRWEDNIVPIFEHPDIRFRDKAIVAAAGNVSARATEFRSVRLSDLEDEGN